MRILVSTKKKNSRKDCSIWRFEDGEFIFVEMEEKVLARKVWELGWGRDFIRVVKKVGL
jgi:ribosomal protein L14